MLLRSAVASWNTYFLPLAMLSDNRLFPVTVGLGLWQGIFSLQRHWRGGLSVGGLR
ncbi:hypothetical protein [Micromonospora sp. NPDC005197]|uniref:hypothetical protein n=1 Tax=unclassified Micromonospora TaxID=2617518 RepID=UPI0033ACF16D